AFLNDMCVDYREHAAEDRLSSELWRLVAYGLGMSAFVDEGRQLRQRLCATLRHAPAGGEGLDEEQPGDAWVVLHECEQLCDRGADSLAPGRLALVGLPRDQTGFGEGVLEQREEAVLAVGERLVEGLAGHFCAAGDLLDGGSRITD